MLPEGHSTERSEKDPRTVTFDASISKHSGLWVLAGGYVLITDLGKTHLDP